MWTVQEAKTKLSEVLKLARGGEAQVVGAQDPCVVISMAEYKRLTQSGTEPPLGKWLTQNAPRIGDLELPLRTVERSNPFADFSDEEEETA
jgi:hypothetical protein